LATLYIENSREGKGRAYAWRKALAAKRQELIDRAIQWLIVAVGPVRLWRGFEEYTAPKTAND
jgi:hypothetical protein